MNENCGHLHLGGYAKMPGTVEFCHNLRRIALKQVKLVWGVMSRKGTQLC